MDIDHPDFFRQLRLALETACSFTFNGFGWGACGAVVAAFAPGPSVFGVPWLAWAIDITRGPLSSSLLPRRVLSDFELHQESSLTKPRIWLLGALRTAGYLVARILLQGPISALLKLAQAPCASFSHHPELFTAGCGLLLLCGVYWSIPRLEVASHRTTIAKCTASLLTTPIEARTLSRKRCLAETFVQKFQPSARCVQFEYLPIQQERTIRLLKLEQHGGNVSCVLEMFPIDCAPPYWAVSYTWGSSKTTHSLVLSLPDSSERCHLSINSNCAAVLKLLAPNRIRFVWIDAICINQQDNAEKEQQVPLMTKIYSGASQVVGYIGDESARLTGNFLLRLLQYCTHEASKGTLRFDSLGCPDEWRALQTYYESEYWRRAWIIQEIVLSPSLIFVNPAGSFSWKHFCYVATQLTEGFVVFKRQENFWPSFEVQLVVIAELAASVGHMKDVLARNDRSQWPTVAELLDSWDVMSATNPRDQVFAMLGLSSNAHEPALRPNYSEAVTVQEIYTNVAAFYLKRGSLRLLLKAGLAYKDGEAMPNVPSWVADLSVSVKRRRSGNWVADKDREAVCQLELFFSPDVKELHLLASIVDGLAVTSGRVPKSGFADPTLQNEARSKKTVDGYVSVYEKTKQMVEECAQDPYQPRMSRAEAHWRTMLLDWFDSKSPAPASAGDALQHTMQQLRATAQASGRGYSGGMRRRLRPKKGLKSMNPGIYHWLGYDFALSRRGYMAWVPPGSREGDILCFFSGCRVPFLVRPEDDNGTFILIGDAYVQGWMHGEALSPEKRWIKLI
jgi:hypothetical protein